MSLLSTLLSASHSRYHKLSSSDPHPPLPNHRHRIPDLKKNPTRKADQRYEAARQAEIDTAKSQKRAHKAARKAERARKRDEREKKREERRREKEEKERKEEEREREEEARERKRLRVQAVERKKEGNHREGELWRGRHGAENLQGYCLEV